MLFSFTPRNFCLVVSLMSFGIGTYAQTYERDGYRQVNTLLSQAHMDIIRDGQRHSICTYNAGFPWPEGDDPDELCSKNVVDPDSCTRKWDNSEEPAGILAKIIKTGKFKWCIHETRFCSAESLPGWANNADDCVKAGLGLTGIAENDNELQGIAKGDYYGTPIDMFKALTITMGKILHVPLQPKFVVIKATGKGTFEDLVDALANDQCYATSDNWYRHPYREAVVDFTCSTRGIDNAGFALHALPSSGLNLEDVYNSDGEGVTVCDTGGGATQSLLAQRDLPKAQFIKVDFTDFSAAFCRKDCDVIVGQTSSNPEVWVTEIGCPEEPITFGIAPPSSGGNFLGAVTHRAA